MKRTTGLAIAVLLMAAPVAAQQTVPSRTMPTALRDGRWALSFGVYGGGGFGVAYSKMTSARNAFTIDVDVAGRGAMSDISRNDTVFAEERRVSVSASVAPGFRRYTHGRDVVASYFAGRLPLGVLGAGQESETEDGLISYGRWTPFIGAEAGWGLEWFPTDAFSLRGEIVVGARYSYEFETAPAGATERRQHELTFGVGRSGLAASIWF